MRCSTVACISRRNKKDLTKLLHSLCRCLQLTKSEVCIKLPIVRNYKVARTQDAVVQVYDYYEPGENSFTVLYVLALGVGQWPKSITQHALDIHSDCTV